MSETAEGGAHRAPEFDEGQVPVGESFVPVALNPGLLGVPFVPDPTVWDGHNPGVTHFKNHFAYEHLPRELQPLSIEFARLAQALVGHLESGPELATALRKLWEAKNSAVLQRVLDKAAEAKLAAASPEV